VSLVLHDWIDSEVAQYGLVELSGCFSGIASPLQGGLLDRHTLGNGLQSALTSPVVAGVLEHRDLPDGQICRGPTDD
jgi:hypothetical protein